MNPIMIMAAIASRDRRDDAAQEIERRGALGAALLGWPGAAPRGVRADPAGTSTNLTTARARSATTTTTAPS